MSSVFEQFPIGDIFLSSALIELFNQLPDTLFWIKDRQHRLCSINPAFAERVKLTEEEILGKTDADFYFPEIARQFMADDRRVIETGFPQTKKFELLTNRFGGVEWRATTKLPLKNKNGEIVGTIGISRPINTSDAALPAPFAMFSHIVELTRKHLSDGISVPEIASRAGMSVATLTRQFRKYMRITPGEFLSQLKISRACKLLTDSPLNVTQIALTCGYESPAAFARAFRRQMHCSPSEYRRK